MAAKAAGIEIRSDVHVETGMEEDAGAADGIVFSAEMKGGDPLKGSESTRKREAAVEGVGRRLQEFAESVGVVEEKRFKEWILKRRSGVDHHAEAIDETRGTQVHFDEYEDGSFSVDRDVQIEASGEGGADFLRGMDFEGEE